MASATFIETYRAENPQISSPIPSDIMSNLYRLNVDEYERMTAIGTLNDDRIELIDGLLVRKMGKNPPHMWATDTVEEFIRALLPNGFSCRKEGPLRVSDSSMPE